MVTLVGGSFAAAWTAHVVARLPGTVGGCDHDADPFALLIHRATAVRAGATRLCATVTDLEEPHQLVAEVLRDLAEVLFEGATFAKVLLRTDVHEFFDVCIRGGAAGGMQQLVERSEAAPAFLPNPPPARVAHLHAHWADTPSLLAASTVWDSFM